MRAFGGVGTPRIGSLAEPALLAQRQALAMLALCLQRWTRCPDGPAARSVGRPGHSGAGMSSCAGWTPRTESAAVRGRWRQAGALRMHSLSVCI